MFAINEFSDNGTASVHATSRRGRSRRRLSRRSPELPAAGVEDRWKRPAPARAMPRRAMLLARKKAPCRKDALIGAQFLRYGVARQFFAPMSLYATMLTSLRLHPTPTPPRRFFEGRHAAFS